MLAVMLLHQLLRAYLWDVAHELWPIYFSLVTFPALKFCSIQFPTASPALQTCCGY